MKVGRRHHQIGAVGASGPRKSVTFGVNTLSVVSWEWRTCGNLRTFLSDTDAAEEIS